jgi:hypothetical protein
MASARRGALRSSARPPHARPQARARTRASLSSRHRRVARAVPRADVAAERAGARAGPGRCSAGGRTNSGLPRLPLRVRAARLPPARRRPMHRARAQIRQRQGGAARAVAGAPDDGRGPQAHDRGTGAVAGARARTAPRRRCPHRQARAPPSAARAGRNSGRVRVHLHPRGACVPVSHLRQRPHVHTGAARRRARLSQQRYTPPPRSQCVRCFKLSNHEGHEVIMTYAGGGTCRRAQRARPPTHPPPAQEAAATAEIRPAGSPKASAPSTRCARAGGRRGAGTCAEQSDKRCRCARRARQPSRTRPATLRRRCRRTSGTHRPAADRRR